MIYWIIVKVKKGICSLNNFTSDLICPIHISLTTIIPVDWHEKAAAICSEPQFYRASLHNTHAFFSPTGCKNVQAWMPDCKANGLQLERRTDRERLGENNKGHRDQ